MVRIPATASGTANDDPSWRPASTQTAMALTLLGLGLVLVLVALG